MRWWSRRSYAVRVYFRAALLIITIAAVILGIWADEEVDTIKRTGYRKCVHANFTFQPDSASALTPEAKLAMCDENAATMIDVVMGGD